MANPEQPHTKSSQPFWIRLCHWFAKQRELVWITGIFGLMLNLFATWLTMPQGSTFSNTHLGTILGYPLIIFGIGISLLMLTGVVTLISHKANAHTPQTRSIQGPTQQNRNILVRALRQEYSRRLT